MANETIYECPGGSSAYIKMKSLTLSNWFGVGFDYDDNYQTKGALRFTNLTIPKNASIDSAELHLHAGGRTGSANIKLKVAAVDEDNSGGGEPFGRPRTTAVNTHTSNPSEGDYFTIGVDSVIEEVVARSGWSSGNAIYFIVEDNDTTRDSPGNWFSDSMNISPNSYLSIRLSSEPNFKPTPKTVTAPSIPATESWGMKISEVGQDVETATEDELYYTSRKHMFKVKAEAEVTSTSSGTITIPHNLGYIPFSSVYVKETSWVRLPNPQNFSDYPRFYIDDTNLYLYASASGQKFYYYIFVDRLAT